MITLKTLEEIANLSHFPYEERNEWSQLFEILMLKALFFMFVNLI
jgi:hypothetical protein